MKRVISKISFVVLIIIPMVILLGNINTKGAQANETLNVEFGIESKETIEVGASTNYNNWSYNETGALYISLCITSRFISVGDCFSTIKSRGLFCIFKLFRIWFREVMESILPVK